MWNNVNPVTVILILVFLVPIFKGFLSRFSAKSMKYDLLDFENNISFLISIVFGLTFGKKLAINESDKIINFLSKNLPEKIAVYISSSPRIISLAIMLAAICIFYIVISLVLKILNEITFYPVFDFVESSMRRRSVFFQRIIGAVSKIPKGLIYIIIVTFLINIASSFYSIDGINKYLYTSKVFTAISENVVDPINNSYIGKSIPKIISDSFKIEVVNRDINSTSSANEEDNSALVYFNGVTLADGVKSNSEIDNLSHKLVENKRTTIDKAKTLYDYVAKNIKYDYDKANKIIRSDFSAPSGAISAYNSKKGVCFDYACLYVAMCRANNIKVKMITGEGYNGSSWTSHAWNQVYVSEEDGWINVDTTFSQGELNYFNNSDFYNDHRSPKVVGQW